MSLTVGGWLGLISFVVWIISGLASLPPFGARDESIFDERRRFKAISELKLGERLSFASSLLSMTLVAQGLHLAMVGYQSPFDINSRAGGKGTIVLLFIYYLPYFLIIGYGFIMCLSIICFRDAREYSDKLINLDRFLRGLGEREMSAFKRGFHVWLEKDIDSTAFTVSLGLKEWVQRHGIF